MSEWQPIATAPKDGENFIAWDDGAVQIYHGDSRDVLPYVSADVLVTDPPYGIEGGRGGDSKDYAKAKYLGTCHGDWPITHWMPLPEPPKLPADEQGQG